MNRWSRGGLVVSVSSYEATDPGSILGVAIFPGSGVAAPNRSESRSGSRLKKIRQLDLTQSALIAVKPVKAQ